jgi:hypothetical protein
MRQQSKEALIILFVIGALILNYPFLHLFDRPWTLFGIPLLYLYLYMVWFVMIVLLIVIVERSVIEPPHESELPPHTPSDPTNPTSEQEHSGPTDSRRSHL